MAIELLTYWVSESLVRWLARADTVLGIVFDSVDPDKKTITFTDRTGATLTRKY